MLNGELDLIKTYQPHIFSKRSHSELLESVSRVACQSNLRDGQAREITVFLLRTTNQANSMISADFEPHACRLTMFMCIMLVFGPINMTLEGVYAKAQPCGSIRSFHIDVSNIDYIILCTT